MTTLIFGETPYRKINRHSAVKEIYYNKDKNNLIIFDPDKVWNTESVINYTRPIMFDLLVQTLNEESGVVVEWYQVQDTTSDFNIYYGLDVESFKDKGHRFIMKKLKESGGDSKYKFNVVIDGVSTPIQC